MDSPPTPLVATQMAHTAIVRETRACPLATPEPRAGESAADSTRACSSPIPSHGIVLLTK